MDDVIYPELKEEDIEIKEEDAQSFTIADSSLDPLQQTPGIGKGREIPGEIEIDPFMHEVKEESEIKVEEEEVPPTVFTDDPLATCHQEPSWKEGKSGASQLMGDSQMVVSEEAAFPPSNHPEQLIEGDHQNSQDTIMQRLPFCSDQHQNRQTSQAEIFRYPPTLSSTTFSFLPSSISTSAALPEISTSSSSFTALEIPTSETNKSAELRENEIVYTDRSNDQVLKALREKNAIFDRTIAMMVQEQEKHDKQLTMMQEHHINQMKTMQEQHNMWLKIQEENFNQISQIQQSQAELQTSIQQLWQHISNNKEQ